MRHARTFHSPGGSPVEFCNLVGACFSGSAVKGRKLSDQL
jgi:hypothetical protein